MQLHTANSAYWCPLVPLSNPLNATGANKHQFVMLSANCGIERVSIITQLLTFYCWNKQQHFSNARKPWHVMSLGVRYVNIHHLLQPFIIYTNIWSCFPSLKINHFVWIINTCQGGLSSSIGYLTREQKVLSSKPCHAKTPLMCYLSNPAVMAGMAMGIETW